MLLLPIPAAPVTTTTRPAPLAAAWNADTRTPTSASRPDSMTASSALAGRRGTAALQIDRDDVDPVVAVEIADAPLGLVPGQERGDRPGPVRAVAGRRHDV